MSQRTVAVLAPRPQPDRRSILKSSHFNSAFNCNSMMCSERPKLCSRKVLVQYQQKQPKIQLLLVLLSLPLVPHVTAQSLTEATPESEHQRRLQ
eukprot:g81171.t1